MITLRNCLGFRRPQAFVYKADLQGSESYKKLQEASSKASDLEYWKEGGDTAQTEINTRADGALQEYTNKMLEEEKTKTKDIISSYETKEGAKAAEIKQELIDKYGKDQTKWKAEYDQRWMQEVKPIQTEKYQKRDAVHKEIWDEIKAVQTRIYAMRDAAIRQMRAAFAARERAKEEVKKRVTEKMKGEVDSEDLRYIRERADFAADLADDGWLSSWEGEVEDYLDSKIDGVELKDSEIEDMTMGIVVLIQEGQKDDPNNPARKFMARLSEREENSPHFDQGVEANDIRLEVLRRMGHNIDDRDSKLSALEEPESVLIGKIAGDKNLAPQMRGMLIGQLSQAENSKEGRAKMTGQVQDMYDTLKALQAGKTEDIDPRNPLVGALAGLSTALTLGGTAPFLQGAIDQKSLENAGLLFTVLRDAQGAKQFEGVKSRYDQFVAATGSEDPDVEKIISDSKSLIHMKKNLPELEKAIGAAETKYRTNKIKELKEEPKVKDAKDVYAYYEVPFSFDTDISALEKAKMPLGEFSAAVAEYKVRAENIGESKELREKALGLRDNINEKVAKIQRYQELREKYGKYGTVKKLPTIAAKHEKITADSPAGVKQELDKTAPTVLADYKVVEANLDELEKATKPYQRSGGGGRRVPGGGAPSSRPQQAPPSQPKKRVDPTELVAEAKVEWEWKEKKPEGYNEKKPVKDKPEWAAKFEKEKEEKKTGWVEIRHGDDRLLAHVEKDKDKGQAKIAYYEQEKKSA